MYVKDKERRRYRRRREGLEKIEEEGGMRWDGGGGVKAKSGW